MDGQPLVIIDNTNLETWEMRPYVKEVCIRAGILGLGSIQRTWSRRSEFISILLVEQQNAHRMTTQRPTCF